jgi:LCP family protein required for cell wall assembly
MPSREPQHVRPRRRRIVLPDWAVYLLLGLFVVGVVGLGYVTFTTVRNLVAGAPLGASGPEPPAFSSGTATAQAQAGTSNAPLWTEGRVTVLLLGIDERQLEHGPWRTDTMILLTMDPVTRTAGMLSIPRDLWVEIPGYGVYDRINTAHFRGDADQYPGGGGPALAMRTVQHNFGVPVNYFVSVNFYAFVQIIDQIGCIPITVPETINDPTYPAPEGNGYDPFYIEAGDHCMGGETLLKYARTRATFGGDFDRAARQQQVIRAVRDHVLSTGQLPNLIARSSDIYATVQSGVNTNLSLQQMIELAQLAAEIPNENICSAVISGEYIEELVTLEDGSQVIIPNREAVRQLVLDIFSGTGHCSPQTQDLASQALAERATISVANGTMTEGLATETANLLSERRLNVIAVGNADRFDYPSTIIYNYNGKDYTARYIATLLNLPETAIVVPAASPGLYDIQVVLGADFQP